MFLFRPYPARPQQFRRRSCRRGGGWNCRGARCVRFCLPTPSLHVYVHMYIKTSTPGEGDPNPNLAQELFSWRSKNTIVVNHTNNTHKVSTAKYYASRLYIVEGLPHRGKERRRRRDRGHSSAEHNKAFVGTRRGR